MEQLLWNIRYDVSPDDVNLVYDPSRQKMLEDIFTTLIRPQVSENPRILNVGFGLRVEEIAALMVLDPRSIAGVDQDTRIGSPKWKRYTDSLSHDDKRRLEQTVSLWDRDVRSLPDDNYDLVCAMRIHPLLQNGDDIRRLIKLSSGLVLISCWRQSGIGYRTDDGVLTEAEHIDKLFDPYRDNLIHAMLPVDAEESHIWVLDTSSL